MKLGKIIASITDINLTGNKKTIQECAYITNNQTNKQKVKSNKTPKWKHEIANYNKKSEQIDGQGNKNIQLTAKQPSTVTLAAAAALQT